MVSHYFNEPLSIYCGGIDNLIRHHDYSVAILESVRPYPMSKFWLHCHHLYVNGKKMSKSTGNILYTDTLLERGYRMDEIRFFLIYGHYRERINYSDPLMNKRANRLRAIKEHIKKIGEKAGGEADPKEKKSLQIKSIFIEHMDNDLNVKTAIDGIGDILSRISPYKLQGSEAAAIMEVVRKIENVLQVLF
jgi:cysteinyl-tRNA synthetase